MLAPKRVLVLSLVNMEPKSSAAGRRMMQLLKVFKRMGSAITYATTAGPSNFSEDLSALRIHTSHVKVNDPDFDVFVDELQPDLVIFDRFMVEEQFGWRVAKMCPNALRVLDSEDLHCLRYARQLAVVEGRSFDEKDLFSDVALREVASIFRSDLTLVISSVEIEILVDVFKVPKELLLYLPFLEDTVTETQQDGLPSFSQRVDFVSIGNFQHAPNMDAVKQLRNHIWPLIRKQLPSTMLHVVGAYPTAEVLAWNDPTIGFLVHGRIDDAETMIKNARVMLAPLRFGAGLKGKLIDAMRCGTPFITTSLGAEGMHVQGAVDDITEFANAAVALHGDEAHWRSKQAEGFSVLNTYFSSDDHVTALSTRIDALLSDIADHRGQNFIGKMLMHHTTKSTYFMSKWIEAKQNARKD